jgi:hypothetical protein
MFNTIARAAGVALTIGFVAAAPALADPPPSQQPAPRQQSLKSLLAENYKLVATTFIPAEVQSDKAPVMLVTLQRDRLVAVCTFGVGGWETLSTSGVADEATACDVTGG